MIAYVSLFVVVTLIIIILIINCRVLKAVDNYLVINENGTSLPVELFRIKNNGIRMFIRAEDSKDNYTNLVIFPKEHIVGLPDGGVDDFVFIGKKYAIQKSKKFDSFIVIFNQNKFAQDFQNNNFPIRYFEFKEGKIIFNSFGTLKKYGEKIILKF